MEKNIDKDIHMLKSYAGMTHKLTDNQGRPKLDQAIENVLLEFQGLREFSTETVRRNAELKSELETYKKIAEKLAEYFIDYVKSNVRIENYTPPTIEELLNWTRKEVENGK